MKIAICGVTGRMGTAVLRILLEKNHGLAAAFDRKEADAFGSDAGNLVGTGLGVTVEAINEGGVRKADAIIDFSAPGASLELLEHAEAHKKPIVIGTTGFSDEEKGRIESAGAEIPVLFAPNMSVGVNVLFKLAEVAARALDESFDIEIFEAHHHFKKDAPSGTARKLLEVVTGAREELAVSRMVSGREGFTGERKPDEIGVMAMRGGDIVGEHTAFFIGNGERLELTHRATNRDILARGAVRAMEFIVGKKPGLFSMFDVLGL